MQAHIERRNALIRAAVPGIDSARRLAALTDEMMSDLAQRASAELPPQIRWSLLALGGYGAGALLPASDIDLLVVSDASSATLRPFVERILYPLWDAGLKVGHQVRSPRQQTRACREDLATLTATLTARVVAGDHGLGRQVASSCAADAKRRKREVLQDLADRDRPGSPYLLEADLKEGAGGRRDYDELTWTNAVLIGAPQSNPADLVDAGVLSPAEHARLEQAMQSVATARWEIQLSNPSSLLTLDDADLLSSVSAQDVQRALADTHHILIRARRRLARVEDPCPSDHVDPRVVLDLIKEGVPSLPVLEEAAWAGAIDYLIGGMSGLMTLRRPGLGHTRTVGSHLLTTAISVHETPTDPVAMRSFSAIDAWDTLLVAALTHDVGKTDAGPGHAERGASPARDTARRFGLTDKASDDVADLVSSHLLLAESASAIDLDEEDHILRVAAKLERRSLLAPLHLLTIADSKATGPGAWSDWHAALVGKLVTRLDAALSPYVAGTGIAERAERTRAQALAMLDTATEGTACRFVREAPLRYLADRDAAEVVQHARLTTGLVASHLNDVFEVLVSVGPTPDTHRVTVATRDRPGLFAALTGSFALSGFNILGIEAVRGHGDVAVDTFVVAPTTPAANITELWTRLDRNIAAALRGHLALGVRLEERARHYRRPTTNHATTVDIATDDPFAAVLTISADDRIGLLHDIARAVTESGLDIRAATVTTRENRIHDVFRLVDTDGLRPTDPGLLGQLAMRLREIR